jgi:tRNA A-37 threonylcarbamoyl transferase component Bud32/tetratricopeptide (TPR) repeat protein
MYSTRRQIRSTSISRYRVSAPPASLSEAFQSRYKLESELGRGGMATVYLAEDVRHRRRVAIKVLHPELAHALGPDRFLREIEIAAQLQHPHILPLLDSGAAAGLLYYVMPYIQGEALRSRLARERQLPLEDVLQITRQIASALAYAHEQGVVHRDIKPENILLGADQAVLADFGIARALSAAGGDRLTETGLALGTPAYMSPEQASGERHLDSRSDIYSLGCVVYEMLAGEPPFTGPTAQAIIAKRFGGPVPRVRVVREGLPEAVDRALERALAKAPADRFRTAARFSQALVEAATARPRVALVPRLARRRSAGLAVIGGFTLVALLLLVLGTWGRRPVTEGTVDPALVAVLPFRVTGGDSSLRYLREGVMDLLAVKLTGEGGPRALDPRAVLNRVRRDHTSGDLSVDAAVRVAQSVGAGRLVDGSVAGTPDQLILTASIISVPGGRTRSRASVAGTADSLPVLLDRLTAQLLAGETGRTTLATLTPLPALRAYLDGEVALRAGRFQAAFQSFGRALEIDSGFAVAAMGLNEAAGWLDVADTERGFRLAWAAREQLSQRDRALLLAKAGPRFPFPSSAAEHLAAAEQAVAAAPERSEAWYELGDSYFHWGAVLGVRQPLRRAAAAFRRALELDSAGTASPYAEPLTHLFDVAAAEGDTATVRRLGTLAITADPENPAADYFRWQMAYVLGDQTTLQGLRSRFGRMHPASLTTITLQNQETGVAMDDARRAVDALVSGATSQAERRWALLHVSLLAMNGGRPREALAALRQIDPRDRLHRGVDERSPITAGLYWDGDSADAVQSVQVLAKRADEPLATGVDERLSQYRNICVLQQWRLAHGDPRTTPAAIDKLRGAVGAGLPPQDSAAVVSEGSLCAMMLEAWLASATGRADARGLVNRLDLLLRTGPHGATEVSNLVVGRLLEALGDTARALAAVRRRPFGLVPRYLSTYLREEGRLAALIGDTAGAITAYQHYLALRSHPEPSLKSEVEAVRTELRQLTAEPE